jgi:hypothetical protein
VRLILSKRTGDITIAGELAVALANSLEEAFGQLAVRW